MSVQAKIFVFIIGIIITLYSINVIMKYIKQKNQESSESEMTLSPYEKGIKSFNENKFEEAREIFAYIPIDDSSFSSSQKYIKIIDNKLNFEKGLKYYNTRQYLLARNTFGNITNDDPNYNKVQEYIKNCDELSKEELKLRNKLEKKYNGIFGGSGWLHEKQSKLLDLGFSQYKSEYQNAPDGSKQLAMYYKKTESGLVINVMLQYSYSINHHYVKVWIE